MSAFYYEALLRADEYARRRKLTIQEQLGAGVDGVVLSTQQKTAIKALLYQELYERERDVYLRFQENRLNQLNGFAIPELIGCHDELWIVEMQVVSPPFIVDFAGARLDSPVEFPEDILEEWRRERIEMFGAKRWTQVSKLMTALRRYGIHLSDVKPGNIEFANPEKEGF